MINRWKQNSATLWNLKRWPSASFFSSLHFLQSAIACDVRRSNLCEWGKLCWPVSPCEGKPILSSSVTQFLPLLPTYSPSFIFMGAILREWPITVAALSMAWTVFVHSNAQIVGSNLTQVMDVCVQVAALQLTDPPSKDSFRLCRRLRNWKNGEVPTKGP
jgi:hypothetical protein